MFKIYVTRTSKVGPDFKNLYGFADLAEDLPRNLKNEFFWEKVEIGEDIYDYRYNYRAFLFWKALTKVSYNAYNPPKPKSITVHYYPPSDWLNFILGKAPF